MNTYKLILSFAGLLLVGAVILFFAENFALAGPLLIAFFIAVAIGFRGYDITKGFSYTMMIFAAVTTALCYPQYFITIGDYKLTGLITPLIQIIMFGMGTEMGLKDFSGVIKMPKAVIIGLVGHFTFMPLVGFALAKAFNFPPEIAAGVVLIGSMPCGLASNVMSYLAKANLALSITLTAVATLLAPFLTPMWMKILGGQFIEINALAMMFDIIKMVIVPIGAGLIFNQLFKGKIAWLDKAMPILSMVGIALIIVVITASGRNNLLLIGPALILCALIHNTTGYTFGYWVGRAFKLSERDSRTIAIEVGMQNGGLASGLAKEMGKAATLGLAPAVFGPLMNITGSILASYWHRKPITDEVEENLELEVIGQKSEVRSQRSEV